MPDKTIYVTVSEDTPINVTVVEEAIDVIVSETIIRATVPSDKIINVTAEEEVINVTIISGVVAGDMYRSQYDTDGNGIVDGAEQLDDGLGNIKTALQVKTHIDNNGIHKKIEYDADYGAFLIDY